MDKAYIISKNEVVSLYPRIDDLFFKQFNIGDGYLLINNAVCWCQISNCDKCIIEIQKVFPEEDVVLLNHSAVSVSDIDIDKLKEDGFPDLGLYNVYRNGKKSFTFTVFEDRSVVVKWLGDKSSTVIWDNYKDMIDIHIIGHPKINTVIEKYGVDNLKSNEMCSWVMM